MLRKLKNKLLKKKLDVFADELNHAIGKSREHTVFWPEEDFEKIAIYTKTPKDINEYLRVFAENNGLKLEKYKAEEVENGWEFYLS